MIAAVIGAAVGVATLLGMIAGIIIYIIRLEGRVLRQGDALAVAMSIVDKFATLTTQLAVTGQRLTGIEAALATASTQSSQALTRLTAVETLVEHVANEVCNERVRQAIARNKEASATP